MDTLTETLERILEIAEITDNIRAAVASEELTEEQGKEVLDSVLDVVIHFPHKQQLVFTLQKEIIMYPNELLDKAIKENGYEGIRDVDGWETLTLTVYHNHPASIARLILARLQEN